MYKVEITGTDISVYVVAVNKYVAAQRAMFEKGLHQYEKNVTKYKITRI
jgi:hypothetical protein